MQIVGSFWNQFVFFISRSLALHTGKNCLYIQSGNFSRDSRFILNRFYFLIWNHSFYYSLASKMKNPYSWLLTLYSWPNLFVKHRNHKARRICILSQVTKCKAQTQATNRKEKVNAKQFKWIILNLHLILSRYICCCIIIFCRDCLILHVTRDGLRQTVPLKFKSVFRTQQGPYNLGINSWAYCTKQQLNVLLIIQSTSVTARFRTKHQQWSPRTMQTPRLMHNKDCTTRTYHHHIQVSSIHHDAGGGVKKDVKKKGIRDEASGLRKGEGGGAGCWMEPYWERLVSVCVCENGIAEEEDY